jgi:hypothetical protein
MYQLYINDNPLNGIMSLDEALNWLEILIHYFPDCQIEIGDLMNDVPYPEVI